MDIKSRINDFFTKDAREKRIAVLKKKKLSLTKDELRELEILCYGECYNMEHPFGTIIEKSMIIKSLFPDNSDFVANEKSDKWDYIGINMGYDPFSKSKNIIDKIKTHISFYKGTLGNLTLVDNSEILPTTGQGDGFAKTTPPPTPTP
jgi:hypothetical protein